LGIGWGTVWVGNDEFSDCATKICQDFTNQDLDVFTNGNNHEGIRDARDFNV